MKKINIRKVDNDMANLIVYYSRKGQNYWKGNLVDMAKGTTECVAEFVQKALGGDLFEIETVREYSKDYMVCMIHSAGPHTSFEAGTVLGSGRWPQRT